MQINYQSVGSGAGIKQVTDGTVDFGASDGPMNDEQIKAFRTSTASAILHFPTVLGAVVPTYNIPGVTADLKFTPEALAGIFLGKITKWNDPAITGSQSGRQACRRPISSWCIAPTAAARRTSGPTIFPRSARSGRTKSGQGTSVNWPVGLGGKGNEGVTGQIKQTPNSIGYVELIYAVQNKIPYGTVKNSSGKFVKADLASVTAAAASAAKDMPDDFRVSITNAPGKTAYPISSFTWLLIPAKIHRRRQARRHQGLPQVDADRRPEIRRGALLRSSFPRKWWRRK